MKLIADEIEDIKKEFADARRTQIIEAEGDFSIEDLIVDEDVLVTVTHGGYIKRTPLSLYRTQRRGGRGKIGATTSEADFVEHLVPVGTHDRLLFFTSKGKVYELKAYELPEGGRAAKGRSIANLLKSRRRRNGWSVHARRPRKLQGKYLFFATRRGDGQKDRARPVRQRPLQRHHRDQSRRRRRTDRRAHHRRQPANRALDARGPGDSLQGRRGALDGPRDLRRDRDGARILQRQGRQERHPGQGRSRLDGDRRARTRLCSPSPSWDSANARAPPSTA